MSQQTAPKRTSTGRKQPRTTFRLGVHYRTARGYRACDVLGAARRSGCGFHRDTTGEPVVPSSWRTTIRFQWTVSLISSLVNMTPTDRHRDHDRLHLSLRTKVVGPSSIRQESNAGVVAEPERRLVSGLGIVAGVLSVPSGVAIRADRRVHDELRLERQRTLVGPEDDMWAAFADRAEPYAIIVGGEIAGCCSVDDVHELHLFFVRSDFEELAAELFAHVVDHAAVVAALPSTVDPAFLSLSLAAGGAAEPVALMYEHVTQQVGAERAKLRLATVADHAAAVAFDRAATGSSEEFLRPFLAARIDQSELYVVESDDQIVATGECRVDHRARGHAHLGLVVGSERRGHGLGTELMHALVDICRVRGLAPQCSTEPDNLAAQHVIRRAGFRSRHRVFRVMMTNNHQARNTESVSAAAEA